MGGIGSLTPRDQSLGTCVGFSSEPVALTKAVLESLRINLDNQYRQDSHAGASAKAVGDWECIAWLRDLQK